MAVNFSASIDEHLDKVRQAYQDALNANGNNASYKTSESFTKEVTQNSGTLFGASNLYQLKHGRKPGRFPPIDDILDWIRSKGITPKDNKTTERQLAFLFARKIAQSGTDIFEGKKPALNVDDQIKVLQEQFEKNLTADFKTEIIKVLK